MNEASALQDNSGLTLGWHQGEPAAMLTFWHARDAALHRALLDRAPAVMMQCRRVSSDPGGGLTFIMAPPIDPDDPFNELQDVTLPPFSAQATLGLDTDAALVVLQDIAAALRIAGQCGYRSPWCAPEDLLTTERGTWLLQIRQAPERQPHEAAVRSLIALAGRLGSQDLKDHPAISAPEPGRWSSASDLLLAVEDSLREAPTPRRLAGIRPPAPPVRSMRPPRRVEAPPPPQPPTSWIIPALYVACFIAFLVLSLGAILVSFQLAS